MEIGVTALPFLGVKKNETSREPKGWELYSVFHKVILDVKTDSFDSLSRAFVDLYRFQTERKEFEERELIHKVSELEKSMGLYRDWKLYAAYVVYGYLWSKIKGDQNKLIEAVQHCRNNEFFLGAHEGGFQIVNSILGFVYSLADSAVNDAFMNDIFGRLENRQSDLAELLQINYFLGLFLFDNKWRLVSQENKEMCAKLSNRIDLNEMISPKEKMVIFPFLEDDGSKYFSAITEEAILSEYYLNVYSNGFYESLSEQESSWLQLSPIWIVKFLFITENLKWNELPLVTPALLGTLHKIDKIKNQDPVVLTKRQYHLKLVSYLAWGVYATFTLTGFIFGIIPIVEWTVALSAIIGVSPFISLAILKTFNIREKKGVDI